ncbi:MAG: geranylgeranylglyceryl/heptaprenylglyceryl phosphate synthase [Bacteroidia bacterium]
MNLIKTLNTYSNFTTLKKEGRKGFAVLLDPDKITLDDVPEIVETALSTHVTYFFVGGSLLVNANIHQIIPAIKQLCQIPVILFPGSIQQIVPSADAIFFLSLISGRNPELLIGNHVLAAPFLKQTSLEILPTGYILIESGKMTTVNYISNTLPIPSDKPDIAACTAMAGEMLGLRLIYMDGGSGAQTPIPAPVISAVSKHVDIPIIVGGGIRTLEEANSAWNAGADVIVIGNAIEKADGLELMQVVGQACKTYGNA